MTSGANVTPTDASGVGYCIWKRTPSGIVPSCWSASKIAYDLPYSSAYPRFGHSIESTVAPSRSLIWNICGASGSVVYACGAGADSNSGISRNFWIW